MDHVPKHEEPLVARLARLARIGLTDAEAATYEGQFRDILRFVGEVEHVRTGPLPPLTATITGVTHILREDTVERSDLAEELLQRAPAAARRFVKVPPVR
jgi:aspartyl-tRNA(Asn)/glutamyl-tRNA(Gln) amidotransferase subunit C